MIRVICKVQTYYDTETFVTVENYDINDNLVAITSPNGERFIVNADEMKAVMNICANSVKKGPFD